MRREKKNQCTNEVQIKEIKIHAEKTQSISFHYKLINQSKECNWHPESPKKTGVHYLH